MCFILKVYKVQKSCSLRELGSEDCSSFYAPVHDTWSFLTLISRLKIVLYKRHSKWLTRNWKLLRLTIMQQ